jgi:hypothetical protein
LNAAYQSTNLPPIFSGLLNDKLSAALTGAGENASFDIHIESGIVDYIRARLGGVRALWQHPLPNYIRLS